MGLAKLLIELLIRLMNLALNGVKEKKRGVIKDEPLNAFDRKFGRLHDDSEPVQQANNRKTTEREIAHSERS